MREIIQIGSVTASDNDPIDKNLLKELAKYYGNAVLGDTYDFESSLVEYFKIHYKDIFQDKNSDFLYKFSDEGNENIEEGDLFKIARHFNIDIEPFRNHFGSNLSIKDGLIYEDKEPLKVIYATDKAINNIVEDLQSSALYYSHLANENYLRSTTISSLQSSFIKFANQNNIKLETTPCVHIKQKRLIRKKFSKDIEGNVIDFRKQSC